MTIQEEIVKAEVRAAIMHLKGLTLCLGLLNIYPTTIEQVDKALADMAEDLEIEVK